MTVAAALTVALQTDVVDNFSGHDFHGCTVAALGARTCAISIPGVGMAEDVPYSRISPATNYSSSSGPDFEELVAVFRQMDRNGDGSLDFGELCRVMMTQGLGPEEVAVFMMEAGKCAADVCTLTRPLTTPVRCAPVLLQTWTAMAKSTCRSGSRT